MEGIHRDHGTSMILEDKAAAFEGDGRVARVTTGRGRRIECDFAVVGLGTKPVMDLFAGTGVEIDNGIVVDECLRTSVEGIYAAGDVWPWPSTGGGIYAARSRDQSPGAYRRG